MKLGNTNGHGDDKKSKDDHHKKKKKKKHKKKYAKFEGKCVCIHLLHGLSRIAQLTRAGCCDSHFS